ncbi:MAG: hypothetical protein Q8O31_04990 [Rhodocyclaceae bacterium]|nr:hypothetical protein [Rhodocyclaceae bacterium]
MKSVLVLVAFLSFSAWAGGDASDGHSHATDPPPAPIPVPVAAPRITAVSEEFEVVMALDGQQWVLYLDQFSSNQPVVGAKIEIEGGGLKGMATELSPGVYRMDASSLATGPLTIAIETVDRADLLSIVLPSPPSDSEHSHGWQFWWGWGWGWAAMIAVGVLVLIAMMRRRTGRIV